jgi:class 3 adenylate cyclase
MGGQKTYAIFGFCDIRSFADCTECLQTDIMLLVNSVAEIVHSQVDKYGGAVNKNIGDAFLLVWKFKDPQDFLDNKPVSDENRIISDMALFGFLKIIAKINKFQHIMAYRKDARLLERIPNFTINMGFGLH